MSLSEARQDLKRIQQVRDRQASTEIAETFICPIEGCNRTVIGSPGHLRNHVRQTEDASHRFKSLNEELEIEFDDEAYHAHWGPGLRGEERDEDGSIYEPGDPWGPGVPESEVIQS